MGLNMETKLRVASITLFMRALIAELDEKDKATESATHIMLKGRKFVRKNFVKPEDQNLLADIVNNAWDDAVTKSETLDLLSVSMIVMELFDSQYRSDIEKYAKINPKYVQRFFNNGRDNVKLITRIKNKELASMCLQAINKRLYDFLKSSPYGSHG